VVALNFTEQPQTADLSSAGAQATVLVSSYAKAGESISTKRIALPAYGALVGELAF